MVEIWWGSGSGPAWKVLLGLEAKGIPYEGHLLEFSKREQKSDAMLAMNPRGKVPVLRHDDVVVYESGAILAYLEAAFPNATPLFGRTPAETGRVWNRVMEHDNYGYPAVRKITGPLFRWSSDSAQEVLDAIAEVRDELGRLEAVIGSRDTVVGDALSAADLSWYPTLASLLRAVGKPEAEPLDLRLLPFDAQFPAIGRMMDRVEALPGFARTIPPHWGGVAKR